MNSFLTVPFLSDAKYIAYLTECADELDSIHFILPGGHLSGGSALRGMIASPDKVLQQGLGQLPGPKKYALFNSRCYNLAFLRDGKKIQPLLRVRLGGGEQLVRRVREAELQ